MTESIAPLLTETEASMKKSISFLESELSKIRAGKVSIQMFDGINVEYYGAPTPLGQVANISIVDARTITIQPWEKNMIQPIERAIMMANMGITPQNDGVLIRIFMPPVTEERRKELVKRANNEGENGKVTIRNIRRDSIEKIKKLQKDGLSEDASKDAEANIQNITDRYIALIEKLLESKEKEIMAI
ncbi:ribosome recycling factor [Polluticaenibacter yanchengensis]|uniref:Ribosome-recycling factor n=1 Tax=Polluticaenibacter yanchengensis TaxID=3014562 RepID=A0ABT4UP34_9BACT|nr:ribosome recycling factor [Chitinophagaceae bacterium LY-5]